VLYLDATTPAFSLAQRRRTHGTTPPSPLRTWPILSDRSGILVSTIRLFCSRICALKPSALSTGARGMGNFARNGSYQTGFLHRSSGGQNFPPVQIPFTGAKPQSPLFSDLGVGPAGQYLAATLSGSKAPGCAGKASKRVASNAGTAHRMVMPNEWPGQPLWRRATPEPALIIRPMIVRALDSSANALAEKDLYTET